MGILIMEFDLQKQEQFADRYMNLLNNSNTTNSKDRELYKQAIESIQTVNKVVKPEDSHRYYQSAQLKDYYKKIASGTSTEEISSLTKKLIDRNKINKFKDLDYIKQLIQKFNSEMNISDIKNNMNDNISIMSSISQSNTDNQFISKSMDQKLYESKQLDMLKKEPSTESFDIKVKMDLKSKENGIKVSSINAYDLINLKSQNSISDHSSYGRKDSKLSIVSDVTNNSVNKVYNKKNNKFQMESIDQEIKLQRKYVKDVKKIIKDFNEQKDSLLQYTNGFSYEQILDKSNMNDKVQADIWKGKLQYAEKIDKINNIL